MAGDAADDAASSASRCAFSATALSLPASTVVAALASAAFSASAIALTRARSACVPHHHVLLFGEPRGARRAAAPLLLRTPQRRWPWRPSPPEFPAVPSVVSPCHGDPAARRSTAERARERTHARTSNGVPLHHAVCSSSRARRRSGSRQPCGQVHGEQSQVSSWPRASASTSQSSSAPHLCAHGWTRRRHVRRCFGRSPITRPRQPQPYLTGPVRRHARGATTANSPAVGCAHQARLLKVSVEDLGAHDGGTAAVRAPASLHISAHAELRSAAQTLRHRTLRAAPGTRTAGAVPSPATAA